MAGHSKWNNIKHKKGKEDAKRAKVFTKIGREIMVAAKQGGSDPAFNPALLSAVDKAKAANMPNDNIQRAIKRGSGELGSGNFEELMYEGYGVAGVAVMVAALTDNRNRTAPEVRHAFEKGGGNMGQDGSVSYMFQRKGLIGIEKSDEIDEETLMMEAIEFGAEDFNAEGEGYEITTEVADFNAVKEGLEEAGYKFAICELTYIPDNTIEVAEESECEKLEKLIDLLEDLDDVQEVYTNWEDTREE